MMLFILLFFGVLAGISTLLFGFGGGFVVVPVMYSLLTLTFSPETPVHQEAMLIAVATSMCIMVPNTALATYKHLKMRTLVWKHVTPIFPYMACGALFGAALALMVDNGWIQGLFIAFLALTILDNTFRSGFLSPKNAHFIPLGRIKTAFSGLGIGALAAFLGVGGSVLTVPLMRRRGASMIEATAMANPLSLPMATLGTFIYLGWARPMQNLGEGYLGYVNIYAALVLMAGAWIGIHLASHWVGKLSDKTHAMIYVSLLCLVLMVMIIL